MSYLKHSLLIIILILGTINVFSQVVITADKTSGCDSLDVKFTISPNSDTITSVVWDFGDSVTLNGEYINTHLYLTPGVFDISALINGNSSVSLSSPVYVYSSPDASFGYSDSLELGSYSFVFQNKQQEIDSFTYTYEWRFPDGSNANTRISVFTFPESGPYQVSLMVENEFGCVDTVERKVIARDILEAPNVFTPNFDGYHDYFDVRTNGVNLYEFSVYARSGLLVYKSETAVINWDGRSLAGYILRPGVYYYVIRQIDGVAPKEKTGFVQILY